MLNLSYILEESAKRHGAKEAFIFGDTRLSYAQINGAANQVANALEGMGIGPGDKVALNCFNLPYFPMVYYAILKVGAIVVPLSVLLKKNEVAYHLQDADAVAYFCFEGTPELPMATEGYAGFQAAANCKDFIVITGNPSAASPIEGIKTLGMLMQNQAPTYNIAQTNESDTAVIIYTSGTTGKPKGAELTHSNLLWNAVVCRDMLKMTAADKHLIVLPLFHIFGQTVQMNAGVLCGCSHVLFPRFDAKTVLTLLQNEKISLFAGVPTMYWGLLNYPELDQFDIKAIGEQLRVAVSGGASLPLTVLKEFQDKFQVPILEGYGMSEGSPVVTFNKLDKERKPGSIGSAVWGVEVKIVDKDDNPVPVGEKGELLYRGHNVMKGYYNKPEANAVTLRNGWMHSGDVAIMDEDGDYFIVDRTKDMIIRGGFNVYPREVEEVLLQHPAVSMVAVIGIPNEQYGEEIKACIVLKAGVTASESEIIAWSKTQIAAYKYPRIVQIREALPMSATGKILKKVLRAE